MHICIRLITTTASQYYTHMGMNPWTNSRFALISTPIYEKLYGWFATAHPYIYPQRKNYMGGWLLHTHMRTHKSKTIWVAGFCTPICTPTSEKLYGWLFSTHQYNTHIWKTIWVAGFRAPIWKLQSFTLFQIMYIYMGQI